MPSLDDLRKRISSVKSTQKITKAMKMVAAAKLRKAQEMAEKGRPYSDKMNTIIQNLSKAINDPSNAPKLLNRGSKLTELLKQNQYSPMTVAEQVITIYAGVKGYLDSIYISQINSFEKGLLELVKSEKPEILESIQKSGKIEEDIDKILSEIINNYKKSNFEKK